MSAVAEAELGQDAPDVGLGRLLGDDQGVADLGVGQAAGDQPQHLGLPLDAAICAGLMFAFGMAVITIRGARDPVGE